MTLQWIPLDRLQPHPDNSNRMPERLMEKLKGHIQRTGLYEPLIVRPLTLAAARAPTVRSGACTSAEEHLIAHECDPGDRAPTVRSGSHASAEEPLIAHECDPGDRAPTVRSGSHTSAEEHICACESNPELTLGARTGETHSLGARTRETQSVRSRPDATTCYQILNGHHRAEVLRQLGHTHARCDVWNVSDEEALILLATLNRLEGRDDPAARARLVAKLAGGQSAEDLARLLPEPADAVERLLKLAEPPPAPLAPEAVALAQRPMTFFLTEEQHSLVREALAEAARPACQCNPSARAPTVRSGSCTSADEALATQGRNPELTLGARATHPVPTGETLRAPTVRSGSHTSAEEHICACESNPELTLGARTGETHSLGARTRESQAREASPATCSRADAIERLALWYLEARNLR